MTAIILNTFSLTWPLRFGRSLRQSGQALHRKA
jgi:hypothetical protein